MTRHGLVSRALLPGVPAPDYALLATCRIDLPLGNDRPPRGDRGAVRTAPGYLPRWRTGGRRRRVPSR